MTTFKNALLSAALLGSAALAGCGDGYGYYRSGYVPPLRTPAPSGMRPDPVTYGQTDSTICVAADGYGCKANGCARLARMPCTCVPTGRRMDEAIASTAATGAISTWDNRVGA
jgi:hypothetical protein